MAQTRGTISGEIVDPSGAVVVGAKVVVAARGIGLVRETITNENGFFTVPALPAGDFEVRVDSAGFKSLTRTGVRLDTDVAVNLRLQLEVGQLR